MTIQERAEKFSMTYPEDLRGYIVEAWLAGYNSKNTFEFDYSVIPYNWGIVAKTWFQYKKEKKKPYKTQKSAEAAIKRLYKLANGDIEEAKEIVEYSMANGYEGLFKDKNNGKSNSNNQQSAAGLFAIADQFSW